MKKLINKFIIIIPVYNASNLIYECINSLLNQDFDDIGIIIRDDISTDNTTEIIDDLLGIQKSRKLNYIRKLNKDILYIKNKKKLYPLGNTYESVKKYVNNKNSIIGVVDGDDKLIKNSAIKEIFNLYQRENVWMIWSQHIKSNGEIGESKKLPSNSEIYTNRNYWSVSHFRTNKAFLFDHLDKKDLKDPFVKNSYFSFAGDAAFLFPFCELCGNERSYFYNEILYYYNCNLPTNEHIKNIELAIKYGNYIRSKSNRYKRISEIKTIDKKGFFKFTRLFKRN